MKCELVQQVLAEGDLEHAPVRMQREVQVHLAQCPQCRAARHAQRHLEERLYRAIATTPVRGKTEAHARLEAYARTPQARLRRLLHWLTTMTTRLPMATLSSSVMVVVLLLVVRLSMPMSPLTPTPGTAQQNQPQGDMLWLVRTQPLPPAALPEDMPLEVAIGYVLDSAPEATVRVELTGLFEDTTRYFAPPVMVEYGRGETIVQFPVNATHARAILGDVARLKGVMQAAEPPTQRLVERARFAESYRLE